MDESSGVGVLDKAALVLAALETGPASLAGLVQMTGLARPTAHRLARALEHRVCAATAERPTGLRDTIPVGSILSMDAGSAAQILLAWEDSDKIRRGLSNSAFSEVTRAAVRKRGWSQSVGEREAGVASVSAPVRSPSGKVIAAVSVSGPIERLTRQPGRIHAPAVVAAGGRLSEVLRRSAK